MKVVAESPILYKRDSKGKVRQWQMQVGHSDTEGATRTISGLTDGKKVTSEWNLCEAKNVGKKNGTTVFTQAIAEMEAEVTIRSERGYFADINKIDELHFTKPMLAKKYEDETITFPVFSQPKLDGIRCIAREDGLWSRQGKRIVSVPHIEDALRPIFDSLPDLVLDGELYADSLADDFNEITSLVRKEKNVDPDAAKKIFYHIYDCVDPAETQVRLDAVKSLFIEWPKLSEVAKMVPTDSAENQEKLDSYYSEYIAAGYEGQMIRIIGKPYENKRSKFLLKRKEFETEEVEVLEVVEGLGNWSGMVKSFRCKLPDGTEFSSGVRGTQEKMTNLLYSKKPDWATVRYFNLTPDGVPRFPVVVDWGYGERND
jgi:DNA ligase-1